MLPIKPHETEKKIAPFYEKDRCDITGVLQAFQNLSEQTSTATIYCDFAQLNCFNLCPTRDLVCVRNSDSFIQKYLTISALDQCMFSNIIAREQCMCPNIESLGQSNTFPLVIPQDLGGKLVLPYQEDIGNDDEEVFHDCIGSTSKIFSLNASECLYSTFNTTKKKLEDLFKPLLFLHLFVGKKLQSWKDTTMSNITQLSTGYINTVQTTAPRCDVTKPFVPVPEKSCGHKNTGHVTGKQLRRQNRMAIKNNAVKSNRKRGMKNGRFQSNVGHRESWH